MASTAVSKRPSRLENRPWICVAPRATNFIMTIKEAFSLVQGCAIDPEVILTVQTIPWHDGVGLRSGWNYIWAAVKGRSTSVFKIDQGGWVGAGIHFSLPSPVLDVSEADAFANIDVLPEPIRSAVLVARGPGIETTH